MPTNLWSHFIPVARPGKKDNDSTMGSWELRPFRELVFCISGSDYSKTLEYRVMVPNQVGKPFTCAHYGQVCGLQRIRSVTRR